MTTMTSEAPVWSIDLLGRPAVVDHEMTTVTALRGSAVFTAHEPGTGRQAEAVVMLPVTGEFVEMPDVMPGGETVKGYWLGPVETGTRVHETFSVFVLSGSTVHRLVMPVAKADARQVVTGRASEGERAAMVALLEQARAHAATVQTHSQWVDNLVEGAHSEANDREWCEDFDDFMDRMGLPRRQREYSVRVEVTATLYFTRDGIDAEAAVDSITRDDVWDALTPSHIEWEAEEDDD